jgi:hypothetical protein
MTQETSTAIGALLALEPRDPPQKPLTVTVSEACRLSGLGRTAIWKFIRDHRLEIAQVGGLKRRLIVYRSLESLLAPAGPSPPTPRKRGARSAGTVSVNSEVA